MKHAAAMIIAIAAIGCHDFDADYQACHTNGWCRSSDQVDASIDAGEAADIGANPDAEPNRDAEPLDRGVVGPCNMHSIDGTPFVCRAPSISGPARAGETLSLDQGEWADVDTFEISWRRISFANPAGTIVGSGMTYVISPLDLDDRLLVSVRGSNSIGSTTSMSAPTDVVQRALPPELLYFNGFETGDANEVGDLISDGIFGTAQITQGPARSGRYAFAVVNQIGDGFGFAQRAAPPGVDVVSVRFALWMEGLPTMQRVASFEALKGMTVVLSVNQDGRLALALDGIGSGPVSSTITLAPATWYVIDVLIDWEVNLECSWRVGGEPQPELTVETGPETITALVLGDDKDTPQSTMIYDDYAFAPRREDYPLGDAKIEALLPNANGIHYFAETAQFQELGAGCQFVRPLSESETTSWMTQTDLPANEASLIVQTDPHADAYVEYQIDQPAASFFYAVRPIFVLRTCGPGQTTGGTAFVVNGVEERFEPLVFNFSRSIWDSHIIPASTWSRSTLDDLRVRFGYSELIGATALPALDSVVVETYAPITSEQD